MTTLGQCLHQSVTARRSVCAGIGPHAGLLRQWGLDDSLAGMCEFSLRTIDALYNRVAAFKPQSTFYERHGATGVATLEETLCACRDAGVPIITDAERGDVGSTMDGYADAYFSDPLKADAFTVSPYLDPGSFEATARRAAGLGDSLFVLTLTSNPEGAQIQHADSPSVAGRVVEAVTAWNEEVAPGSFGLIVSTTVGDDTHRLGIDLPSFLGVFLVPGIGTQGADTDELRQVFGSGIAWVLASASRSVLTDGPVAAGLREGFARMLNAVESAPGQSESR